MRIKKIKQQNGTTLLEMIVVPTIMILLVIIFSISYTSLTKPYKDIDNIIFFSYLLQHSTSDKNLVLTYNEIVPFQQKIINNNKALLNDCAEELCDLLYVDQYPKNTYITLSYDEGQLSSFKLISQYDDTMFNFLNRIIFDNWYKITGSNSSRIRSSHIKNISDLYSNVTVSKLLTDGTVTENSSSEFSCLFKDCTFLYSYNVPFIKRTQ